MEQKKKPFYEASFIKRRTKAEMEQLRTDLYDIVKANEPVTVRQVFYIAVGKGLIQKSENSYQTVGRIIAQLRLDGIVPWYWVVDFSRSLRKRRSQNSVQEAVEDCARLYRKSIWRDLDVRVEIWTEKETLSGVLLEETWDLDVGLFPCRGYPSLSFLHSAGEAIEEECWKPTYIYYFGDHDPSGQDISRIVRERLFQFAPSAKIYFKRLAVNPDQIAELGLPTRPTKKTDSRGKNFKGDSVEVETIQPAILRRLCREAIESHLPTGWLDKIRVAEESERNLILTLAADKTIGH